jgi:hypothetical protein
LSAGIRIGFMGSSFAHKLRGCADRRVANVSMYDKEPI